MRIFKNTRFDDEFDLDIRIKLPPPPDPNHEVHASGGCGSQPGNQSCATPCGGTCTGCASNPPVSQCCC
ncbi:hypothetical protein [Nannocystis punicea]|uniref:Uncharacterized protein n=1 Tax=Nannocystis punicea TaxID=2995304 RepID=A0ABY7HBU7_9BACT|nr:hypothetical protein [Nannocystis poenicansa]WAS96588.1 hypothetical protein O0S08_10560 [Nannocystis poenicansa]